MQIYMHNYDGCCKQLARFWNRDILSGKVNNMGNNWSISKHLSSVWIFMSGMSSRWIESIVSLDPKACFKMTRNKKMPRSSKSWVLHIPLFFRDDRAVHLRNHVHWDLHLRSVIVNVSLLTMSVSLMVLDVVGLHPSVMAVVELLNTSS